MVRNALLILAIADLHCALKCNAYYSRALTEADDDRACVNDAWAAYKRSTHMLSSDAWKVALRSPLRPHAIGTHARAVMASRDVLAAIAACDHHTNLTCAMVRLECSSTIAICWWRSRLCSRHVPHLKLLQCPGCNAPTRPYPANVHCSSPEGSWRIDAALHPGAFDGTGADA